MSNDISNRNTDTDKPPEERALDMLKSGLAPSLPEGADWRWGMAAGVVMAIGGAIGLLQGALATLVSVLIFGAGLLAAAGLHIVSLIRGEDARRHAWLEHLLMAAMYAAMGLYIVLHPAAATAGLTLMLCVFFAAIAFLRLSLAWRRRARRAEAVSQLLSAVASLALLGVVIAYWPLSTLWAIGVLVSVEVMMNGWMLIFAAATLRGQMKQTDAGAGSTPGPADSACRSGR